jgi:uncharacterized delta-60 repeat protein
MTQKLLFFIGVFLLTVCPKVQATPGDVDLNFNAGAFAHPTDTPGLRAIAVQSDGKILVGGIFTSVAGTARNFIARLNRDGSLDTSFNAPLQTFGSNSGMVLAIALQTDGKILVGGTFYAGGDFTIMVRLNPDGSLDGSFSVGTANQSVSVIVIQPNGKILIGGNFGLVNNTACPNLARLNQNGSLDVALGTVAGINSNVDAIALQPDGKIIIGGGFIMSGSTRARLTRLNADGTCDVGFNVGDGANSDVYALALQTDGKIIVGGFFTNISGATQNALARLNADGTIDSSFAPVFFAGSLVYSIVLQPNGKILFVGNFGTVNSAVRVRIARLNADGSLDSFYPTNAAGGANNTIYAVARQSCAKVLIGGDFTTVAGVSRARLAQLLDTPQRAFADFDGDGCADLSVFRPTDRNWYFLNSSNGAFYSTQWGLASDKLAPADYDGDGKTDIAVWREAPVPQAAFYILNSSNSTVRVEQFGQTGDVPIAGDFDGDGRADVSVYRNAAQAIFFYRASLNNPNGNTTFQFWGITGDVPVVGDYDGDGRTDSGVFRPSSNTWLVLRSSNSSLQSAVFGLNTDKLVPADYDGDGKTDVAVFRGGVWYLLLSSTQTVSITTWGIGTDRPVPADYDGDGKTDLAIYRNGIWWILQSLTNSTSVRAFGLGNDLPIPSAYIF